MNEKNINEVQENEIQENKILNSEEIDNKKPFKSFNSQLEFDNYNAQMRRSTEERIVKSLTKNSDGEKTFDSEEYKKHIIATYGAQIRAEEERKSKLSREQLEKETLDNARKEIEQERLELNRDKIKSILENEKINPIGISHALNRVTLDLEASKSMAFEYIEAVKEERLEYEKSLRLKMMNGQPIVQTGTNTDVNSLQEKYANAKKQNDKITMAYCIRVASEKGIIL